MTGLSCREAVELVTSHLEGKLDRDTERRFTEHLAECEGCDRYLDQFRLTIRMLGELPAESPPDDAGHRLLSASRNWRGS
jgi:predicted anti-sigma-YlaC factor YlaD